MDIVNGDKRRAWQITKLLRLWNIELQEELSYQLIQNFRAQLRPYSIEIQRGSPKRYWAVHSLLRSYHIVGQAYRQLRVNYHHWTSKSILFTVVQSSYRLRLLICQIRARFTFDSLKITISISSFSIWLFMNRSILKTHF